MPLTHHWSRSVPKGADLSLENGKGHISLIWPDFLYDIIRLDTPQALEQKTSDPHKKGSKMAAMKRRLDALGQLDFSSGEGKLLMIPGEKS